MNYNCLSVKQPWANRIASGRKTIEVLYWATEYRGELLIVSSKIPPIEPAGCVVAICDLVDCRPFTWEDQKAAGCPRYSDREKAWVLDNIRRIKPFPMRGERGIYIRELDPERIIDWSGDENTLL